jgi:hypothetical protein
VEDGEPKSYRGAALCSKDAEVEGALNARRFCDWRRIRNNK